ncbi:MAG: hypothetical protein OQK24_02155 [Magnetovibrio sp.]|nr:hypothetical protein [Magnetovibrio sp.]
MDDNQRIELILVQAKIAKSALRDLTNLTPEQTAQHLNQATLAVEAITLLADTEFHVKEDAA